MTSHLFSLADFILPVAILFRLPPETVTLTAELYWSLESPENPAKAALSCLQLAHGFHHTTVLDMEYLPRHMEGFLQRTRRKFPTEWRIFRWLHHGWWDTHFHNAGPVDGALQLRLIDTCDLRHDTFTRWSRYAPDQSPEGLEASAVRLQLLLLHYQQAADCDMHELMSKSPAAQSTFQHLFNSYDATALGQRIMLHLGENHSVNCK